MCFNTVACLSVTLVDEGTLNGARACDVVTLSHL